MKEAAALAFTGAAIAIGLVARRRRGRVRTRSGSRYEQIASFDADEAPSAKDFQEKYLLAGQPVIIRGAYRRRGSPLLSAPPRCADWTLDYLCEKCGDNMCIVRKSVASDPYRLGKRIPIERMQFKSYVSAMGRRRAQQPGSDYYLAAISIRRSFPQIADEFELPKYVQKVHSGPFMWLAQAGHYEFCHFDPDDGFLMLLRGTKRVRLFSPSRNSLDVMCPNKLGSHGRTIQSQVDLDLPEDQLRERFPRFANEAHGHEATLEAGDALFIPALWWHQITSVTECISVNVFWGDDGDSAFMSKVLVNCEETFLRWILNVVEQNRRCGVFPTVLTHLDQALYFFLHNQWHERVTPEQLGVIKHRVFEHLRRTYAPADELFTMEELVGLQHRQAEELRADGSSDQSAQAWQDSKKCACRTNKLRIRGLTHREELVDG
jgi:hypothetical protein